VTTPIGPCGHFLGAQHRHCGSREGVRPYLVGPRCPAHTPAALAGHAEPGSRLVSVPPVGVPLGVPHPCNDLRKRAQLRVVA
jgi:hypothetical protein